MVQTSQFALQSYAAIVLATGVSRRFGAADKLAAQIDGVPLLQRVLNTVTSLPLGQILLVVGDEYSRPDRLSLPRKVQIVRNHHYRSGMGTSMPVGAANITDDMEAAFVVLGDMPFVPGKIFCRLAGRLDSSVTIARPLTPSGAGHPVLFS